MKKVYQVYVTYCPNDQTGFWGLGDFLRGCISLYQKCKYSGNEFYISLQRHPLRFFLKSTGEHKDIDSAVIYSYPNLDQHTIDSNPNDNIFIFTNSHCNIPLSLECKEYFKSFLSPSESLKKKIDEKMIELDITPKNYSIVHIRTGDKYLVHKAPFSTDICNTLYAHMIKDGCIRDKTVLLTDNIECSSILNKIDSRLVNSKTTPVHIGHKNCENDTSLEGTLIDLYLIIYSKEIHSYPGSGFPMIVSYIYDIPYKNTYLHMV